MHQAICAWLTVVMLLVPYGLIDAAIPHKHSHDHNEHHTGERVKDGSFRPKDADHHGGDGEHYMEFDHEAILGSVKEADEYHSLTPDESKERLRILVETRIDTNHDGFVDKHELKAHILRSFKSLSEEEANDRFDEIDGDNDNKVTWSEYLKDTYGMSSEAFPELKQHIVNPDDPEQEKMINDDWIVFGTADTNNDGSLNREEFVMFISPEEHPIMLPILLNQTLRDKDKNADGKISFQEFLGDSAKERDKAWLLAEKERFDSEHDKDGDGVLNGNEILSWVVPSNEEVAMDEVNHLFAATDSDHDEHLSYDEIADNHELWVGSEATDYGDHLHDIMELRDEL